MKKFLLILIITVSFGLVSQASALLIGDSDYVGSINDGIPSNEANELAYINTLKDLPAGQANIAIGTETYNRIGSSLNGLPTALFAGNLKQDNDNTSFNATGFEYIIAKYDAAQAGSLVWYLGDDFVGVVTLPSTYNAGFGPKGLSHTTAFNATGGNPVPEPATIILLGVGLLGAAGASRKKFKKK